MEDQIDELSKEIVHSQALVLERSIHRSTSSAVILRNHIHTVNGDMSDFDEYANDLYSLLGGITNLQLAPQGIVTKIYPLQGHEKALGHDIFQSDERKKEAFLAKKSKKLTLAGPFTLVQGGVAIIARSPVFLDDKHLGKNIKNHKHAFANKFWGFASALMYLDDLLKTTDLHLLKDKNYLFRLWRYHPDTNKVDIFAGNKNLPNKKIFTKSITIPNGQWYLDIEYIGSSFSKFFMNTLYTINFLVSILLGYLLYITLNRPKELKKEVAIKTNELKHKNSELLHEKLELKKLTNAVTYNNNAIFIANKNGIIEYINPAFEQMTGFGFDDVLNNTTDLFQSEINYVMKNKSTWSGQDSYEKKNNELFECITTISIVSDSNNSITSYVGVCEDITQKIKDDELLHEKEILLLQQSKMAAMGEMFENIAHQWKQPLSAILTMSSGLKMLKEMDALTDKVFMESINNISSNVLHLSDTVDDFKNFFRQDKTMKEFLVRDVLNKSLSLLTSQLNMSDIEIVLNESDSKVFGISNELIQVFMNIITNAKDELLKIKSKRYIFIDIKEVNQDVIIEIKDNAGGIPMSVIDKIFDSYFTTKEKEGTGIGLYMSRKIIEDNMSGNLKAINTSYSYDNEDFSGAKFIITLPKRKR